MRVKYLGPRDQVFVPPYGRHWKDKIEPYPDEFAEDLVATSKKNKFEFANDEEGLDNESETAAASDDLAVAPDFNELTVKELIGALETRGIEIPKKARKAELIELLG